MMLGASVLSGATVGSLSNNGSEIYLSAGLIVINPNSVSVSTGVAVVADNSRQTAFAYDFSPDFGPFTRLTSFSPDFELAFGTDTKLLGVNIVTNNAGVFSGGSVYGVGSAELHFSTMPALVQTSGVVLPTVESVSISTYQPIILVDRFIDVLTAEVGIICHAPRISTNAIVRASVESLIISTNDSTVSTGGVVDAVTASVEISTTAATIRVGRNPKIYTERQKFSPENLITLFELDATAIGGEYMRFTSSAEVDTTIRFGGHSYVPVPIEASGFEMSGSGSLPTPTLRVLNAPALQSGVIALGDLLGATLYRIRTFKTFLDDGEDPDPNARFPVDIFKLERKTTQTKVYIEWELSAAIDQEGRMLPSRQIIKDFCTHVYRVWDEESGAFDYTKATCPYSGSACFDANNVASNNAGDRCGKRLSSCRARFGANGVLPTRAFPGVKKV